MTRPPTSTACPPARARSCPAPSGWPTTWRSRAAATRPARSTSGCSTSATTSACSPRSTTPWRSGSSATSPRRSPTSAWSTRRGTSSMRSGCPSEQRPKEDGAVNPSCKEQASDHPEPVRAGRSQAASAPGTRLHGEHGDLMTPPGATGRSQRRQPGEFMRQDRQVSRPGIRSSCCFRNSTYSSRKVRVTMVFSLLSDIFADAGELREAHTEGSVSLLPPEPSRGARPLVDPFG